jgi:predicted PurR-regulated permease PerM
MSQDVPSDANGSDTVKGSHRRFILVLAVILLAVFLLMIHNVLIGVILGVMLWAITRRVYEWILTKVRRPGGAAGLALLATLLVIIVPITILFVLAAADASTMADTFRKWFEPSRQALQDQLDRLSRGSSLMVFGYEFTAQDLAQRIEALSGQVGGFLINILQKAAGGIFNSGLMLFITLYTLYFFYVDGQAFLNWVKRVLPLDEEQSEQLIHDFLATAVTTLQTMVVIGVVQGTLGGVAFWIAGIPSPFFWGVVIAFASVIPAVGAQIILVPVSIVMMLVSGFWTGMLLLLFSWGIVGHVDNVLRPYLVGRSVKLHQLLVLVATIGGIEMFGFWGVILGPVIASLLKAVLRMYVAVRKDSSANAEASEASGTI